MRLRDYFYTAFLLMTFPLQATPREIEEGCSEKEKRSSNSPNRSVNSEAG